MTTAVSAQTKEEQLKSSRTSEIVRAARTVITALGYGEASMDRIAQEAGVAKGTLYLYFKNKDELLARTFAEDHELLMERMQRAVNGVEGYQEKIRSLVRETLKYSTDHQSFFQALYETPELTPFGSSSAALEIRSELDTFGKFIKKVIAEGMREGEFRQGDPSRFAMYLTQLLYGAVATKIDRVFDANFVGDPDAMVDFFLRGTQAE